MGWPGSGTVVGNPPNPHVPPMMFLARTLPLDLGKPLGLAPTLGYTAPGPPVQGSSACLRCAGGWAGLLGPEGCNFPTRARFAVIQEAKFMCSTSSGRPRHQIVQISYARTPAASTDPSGPLPRQGCC